MRDEMLDYRIHSFLAVCHTGSYTHAAEILHVSQPAVSQHIHQLEKYYGQTLFIKNGRGVEATPAGLILQQAFETMENDEERLKAEIRSLLPGKTLPPLCFGCTRTIADYVAPQLLALHLQHYPNEQIRMHTGNTHELVDLIDRGIIDFALIEGPFDSSKFDSATFSHEAFIGIGQAGKAPQTITDLLDKHLILREAGSGTRELFERHLAAYDVHVSDFAGVIELSSIPAIKACVAAGTGISFMYRVAVEKELSLGTLVDITPQNFAIEHNFSLIWQHGSRYNKRYLALLTSWRELYNNMR